MTQFNRHVAALFAVWLALVVISLLCRSYIPIDETRYVTVAWNMWQRGDFLVPWLNGVAYSHKPPMLFWLMNAGWAVFGVNDWWPRLVPSLFALGSGWLTIVMARRLWPQDANVVGLAPMILVSSALWAVFTTATMFDMLVAFFTLVGMLGILIASQGDSVKGWGLVGVAIGGGLLAKGPTILLQILPLAMLAPWWKTDPLPWKRWYGGMLLAILLGAAIALIWAIPAGVRGGETYRNAIFWGQTADRMVNSFAHRRPLWWYLPLLPIILFPWMLWLPVWRGFVKLAGQLSDDAVRFSLAWMVPVFIAFSFISGKQMHYLLPIFPAFALLAARGLSLASGGVVQRADFLLLAVTGLFLGVGLVFLPGFSVTHGWAPWIRDIPAWGGWLIAAIAILLFIVPPGDLKRGAWKTALFGAFVIVMFYVVLVRSADTAYDMRPISAELKKLEDKGVSVVFVGRYAGTFDFIGRLKRPLQLCRRATLDDWFERNPEGRAIVFFDRRHPLDGLKPDFVQYYQGDQVAIIKREDWMKWQSSHKLQNMQSDDPAPENGQE